MMFLNYKTDNTVPKKRERKKETEVERNSRKQGM
jgi:hypothetical protein